MPNKFVRNLSAEEIIRLEQLWQTPLIKERIKIARDDFDRKFNGSLRPTSNPKSPNVKIRIAGIGMFDREHNQLGRADNGIELHPVLGIEFLDN